MFHNYNAMHPSMINRTRKTHVNLSVESIGLDEDHNCLETDITYTPTLVTSVSQVFFASQPKELHLPHSPPQTKRMPFVFSTPLETPDLNLPSPSPSPPRLKKRKFITVDQIRDRDLQRLQCPLSNEFEFENDCGGDKLRRKWRLSPRQRA